MSVDELRSHVCDDRVFADIASDQIPLEISLSIKLGLNETQTEWNHMKGSDATYYSLIMAFIEDGNCNAAEFVIERFVHYHLQQYDIKCKPKGTTI